MFGTKLTRVRSELAQDPNSILAPRASAVSSLGQYQHNVPLLANRLGLGFSFQVQSLLGMQTI